MHISSMLCGCFLRRCILFQSILVIFFLRFWRRLETTSRWVGSEFSCHWCCFPRCWFGVNCLCSSWFSRRVFGDRTSALFIARGLLRGFLISFCLFLSRCSLISLHLLLLITSLVALFLSPYLLLQVWIVLSSLYALCASKVISSLNFELLFFGSRLPFPLPQVVSFLLLLPLV